MTKILVTGALGFIGSYFIKYILESKETEKWNVVGFNRNSNQKNFLRLVPILNSHSNQFNMVLGDLTNPNDLSGLCEDVDYVVNFAAKTFVDFSIRDPRPFINSNIIGTYNLLEEVRKNKSTIKRYIQISTDEVYGAILNGSYKEDARLNPTNPYSASKAAGDMLALSYYNTYKLPIIITRTENNYGQFQHPQKAMPKFVRYALNNEPLPVYGDGEHRRMWLYVEDHCTAILHLLEKGIDGEIYHIAGEQELTNNELAKRILRILGKPETMIKHIDDFNVRPGHDRRYALDTTKLKQLGWTPKWSLDAGLQKTVEWYRDNDWWFNQ